MNNCSENHSESISTQNCNSNLTYAGEAGVEIAIPILNLALIVLTLLLGSGIIYCVYHNKTLRDPVSVLIVSVAATLMVLTIVYSLYSLSILTDLPLIGDCNNLSGNIILIVITFHFFFVCFTIGLIATVQLLTIKYGRKRVTKQKVIPVFAALVFLAMVLSIVDNVADNISTHSTSRIKIRGSVCALNVSTANPIFAISIMLGYVIPLTVTLVMSCATHRTLKNCVVEMDTDHSVVRSVLVMSVVTVLLCFVSKIPLFGLIAWAYNVSSVRNFAYLIVSLQASLDPPCTLLLFITIHKTIRHTVAELFGKLYTNLVKAKAMAACICIL